MSSEVQSLDNINSF